MPDYPRYGSGLEGFYHCELAHPFLGLRRRGDSSHRSQLVLLDVDTIGHWCEAKDFSRDPGRSMTGDLDDTTEGII